MFLYKARTLLFQGGNLHNASLPCKNITITVVICLAVTPSFMKVSSNLIKKPNAVIVTKVYYVTQF